MREAVVVIIVKDGLVLGISRRHDATKFGLIGGKVDPGETLIGAAIREVKEETGLTIGGCVYITDRVEPKDTEAGEDFYSYCYYASWWSGTLKESDEGHLRWLSIEEITNSPLAAFGDYNRKAFKAFQEKHPEVFNKLFNQGK